MTTRRFDSLLLIAVLAPLLACELFNDVVPQDPDWLVDDPPGAIVPGDKPAETYTCDITNVPPGVSKEDLETWLKDHAHLVKDDESFQELCKKLKVGVDDAILHSSLGNQYPMDATATYVFMRMRAAGIVSITEIEVPDGGAAAILGTSTDTIEAEFPCGEETPERRVLCASTAPPPAGDWIVVSAVMQDVIPLDTPDLYGQFAFVFDGDGDTTNNYEAPAEYPNDFFDGTDRWYQVNIDPTNGPVLSVMDATNGSVMPSVSNARFVFDGNLMMALIPADEMAACPMYRTTSFVHHGDYGLNPPHYWAGDTEPTVSQGLEAACEL